MRSKMRSGFVRSAAARSVRPLYRSSFLGLMGAAVLFALPTAARAQDGIGMNASAKATAKDVGLPLYPGAKQHKENGSESNDLNMGAWGGSFGFKIAVLKLESTDSPQKVAAFYLKALAKYGKVLNCSDPAQSKPSTDKGNSSNQLTCDGDEKNTSKGEVVYKSGTKDSQHIVSVEPNGSGALIDLVFLEAHGGDDDKKPAS